MRITMKLPLAEQLFVEFVRIILNPEFTEQKLLMNLINLPKKVHREITPAGSPALGIQHEYFGAIILLSEHTHQLSSVMVLAGFELFKEMLAYAHTPHWLKKTNRTSQDIQLDWHQDEHGQSNRLLFKRLPDLVEEASVAFFDYPGIFDSHAVYFRRRPI